MIDGFKLAEGNWSERQTQAIDGPARSSRSSTAFKTASTAPTPPKGLAMLLGEPGEQPKPSTPGKAESGGFVRQAIAGVAILVVLCWGAWMTKAIIDVGNRDKRFVKMELQGVIAEYLQAQARSGNDERSAAEATTAFMGELDKAVADLAKSGKVVLVNEAVVDGDIPDVTAAVKSAVYAKVPMPRVAAGPVQREMEAYRHADAVRVGGAPSQNAQ